MGSGKGNVTYKDNDSENKGGKYREDDGVDIEEGGDNFAIGYTQAGEWLEYTVNVKADGDCYVTAHVASGNETSAFSLSLDDKELVAETKAPKTGEEWNVYKDLSLGKVKLTKGEHILRLSITSDFVNVDWLRFSTNENGDDSSHTAIKTNFRMRDVAETFGVYDVNGMFMGKVEALDRNDLQRKARSVVRTGGVYIVKSIRGGKTYRISVAK